MINKEKVKLGFSLVEVLLAVFILEIGLLGIATFYSYSHRIAKMARNQTIATNLAQGVLDEELSYSYANIPAVAKTRYSNVSTNAFYNYYKEVTVTCIDANLSNITCDANAHMKKIVVVISWTEDNSNKSVQMATIKAEN